MVVGENVSTADRYLSTPRIGKIGPALPVPRRTPGQGCSKERCRSRHGYQDCVNRMVCTGLASSPGVQVAS